ncbi:MAG: hypothetical protein N2204_05905 [Anaerolineae bacterium]|nr:hypothetical protein [Anaerolineae bacterium]
MDVTGAGNEIFIVRVWREPHASVEEGYESRGVVEHLRSGQRRYFRRLDDLAAFIRERAGFRDVQEIT